MSDAFIEEAFPDPFAPMDPEERMHLAMLFNQYQADTVKRLAQRWLGRAARTRKQECIEQLLGVLAAPDSLRTVYDSLTPFEKSGLWMLLQRGGTLPVLEFAPCLLAAGYEFSEQVNYHSSYRYGMSYGSSEGYLQPLISLEETGLLLNISVDSWSNSLEQTAFVRHTATHGVAMLRRLLPHVQPVPPRPLELPPCTESLSGEFRRPAQAAMPIVSLMEALRGVGEFSLTNKGAMPRPFINRIVKRLGDGFAAESPAFPDPAGFYLQLLISAQFVTLPLLGREISLDPDIDLLMAEPYAVQATHWLNGYRSLKVWHETLPAHVHLYGDDLHRTNSLHAIRNLVVTALGALPDPGAWYATSAFSEALFARTRGRLSLGYQQPWHPSYSLSKAAQEKKYAEHLEKRRLAWQTTEQPLIADMLQGPLFALGLVEIASLSDRGQAFRLTDLGRSVLYGVPLFEATQDGGAAPDAWIIQPNLEVIAYLDRARPQDLAFLAKIAERKSSTGPVAVYSITRESAYAAFEAGFTVDELLRGLQQSSVRELPDVLIRSLREWAARRERIVLYPQTSLLQYADTADRDAALPSLPRTAQPLGDRFVLLPDGPPRSLTARKEVQSIDYAAAPFRCVSVTEEGHLRIDPRRADLLVASELGAFADPVPGTPGAWTLTRESVQRAVNAGHTAEGILKALGTRARSSIPPILVVAVPRWARKIGQPAPASLHTLLVLELPTEEIAAAVEASHRFQPLLRSRLGPRAFSIAPEDEAAARRLLAEYGLLGAAALAPPEPGTTPTSASRSAAKTTRPRSRKAASGE